MEFDVRGFGAGKVQSLRIQAANKDEVARVVAAQNLRLLAIEPRRWTLSRPGKRSRFSILRFSQELIVLLEAGLTVVEAIETLVEKERQTESRRVLERLLDDMHQGKGFAGALEEQAAEFPPLYVNIVRAAEQTSGLEEALGRYVGHELQLEELRAKVVRASIYPLILLAVGSIVTLFLLGYVVPQFASVYQETGRRLPTLSQWLLNWGKLIDQHPALVLAAFTSVLMGISLGLRQLERRGGFAQLGMQIPVLKRYVRLFQLARFYLTVGMLLEGGIPIVRCLDLVVSLGTQDLRQSIRLTMEALRQGQSVSTAFDRQSLTTPVALRMLRVGEQSGMLGKMMSRIARSFDMEVGHAVEWFSRVFEPALMTAMGLVIGLIVILLYMPIFDLAGSL